MKGKAKYRQQRRQNDRSNGHEAIKIDVTVFGEAYAPLEADGILDRPIEDGFDLPEIMGDVARHYIDRALEESGGNKTKAAKLLGLNSYQTLTNWIEKYGS